MPEMSARPFSQVQHDGVTNFDCISSISFIREGSWVCTHVLSEKHVLLASLGTKGVRFTGYRQYMPSRVRRSLSSKQQLPPGLNQVAMFAVQRCPRFSLSRPANPSRSLFLRLRKDDSAYAGCCATSSTPVSGLKTSVDLPRKVA